VSTPRKGGSKQIAKQEKRGVLKKGIRAVGQKKNEGAKLSGKKMARSWKVNQKEIVEGYLRKSSVQRGTRGTGDRIMGKKAETGNKKRVTRQRGESKGRVKSQRGERRGG